ncbi:MAG TPA: hypothetical protein VFC03_02325 [Acidimicrobiales bacterium]|nr:hypothetical protein [Acidimicrobiales bacterium]
MSGPMPFETDQRPWGSYTVLDDAATHKVKRIEVLPGKRLSYQRHARRLGAPAALVCVSAVACLSAVGLAAPAGATAPGAPAPLVAVTTTTEAATTSTSVPPSTGTAVPSPTSTTTTTPASTTSSQPTTTTAAPSTTTTTTAPLVPPSGTPWGLIGLIAVLVIAIVVVALLFRSRKKRAIETEWRHAVIPALSDAQLARESLVSGTAASDDPEVRGAAAAQVERAAVALEKAAGSAPEPQAAGAATAAAGALRGLAFAVEADRLLRNGPTAPTGLQLAQADEARRARTTELNTALARLSTRISSGQGAPSAG